MTCPPKSGRFALEFFIYGPRQDKEKSMKASKFSEAQIALVLKQAERWYGGCGGLPQGRD
jgi:hypothetical protein